MTFARLLAALAVLAIPLAAEAQGGRVSIENLTIDDDPPPDAYREVLAEGLLYNSDSNFYARNLQRYASVTPAEVKAAMQQWLGRPVLKITVEPGDRPPYVEASAKKPKKGADIKVASVKRDMPAEGAPVPLDFPDVQHTILSNGVKLHYAQRTTVPVTQIGLAFDAGYSADAPNARGLQNLTLSLLDEGADGMTSQQIAEEEERLGATITIEGGYALARAPKGLKGGEIVFPKVTVGGTHTALMAAVLADGTTVIENAAREPEVVDLAACLQKMGAKIEGAGTSTITVRGVSRLGGAHHAVLPDRIETGTYAMAVAMTGGDVVLEGARPELLQNALDVLEQAGAKISATNEGIRIARNGSGIRPVEVTTEPFPGFPTDLQAQLMALMTRAKGNSRITETITSSTSTVIPPGTPP